MTQKLFITSVIMLLRVLGISGQIINGKECGLRSQEYIVGGIDAKENEFPFMVSLQVLVKGEGRHFCGGSLINSRYILTAAHCIEGLRDNNFNSSQMVVLIGTNQNDKSLSDKTQYHYKVDQWIVNGCYKKRDSLSDDIGLLRLAQPIKVNQKSIGTICLPQRRAEPITDLITVAGWGVWTETTSFEKEGTPNIMQKSDITLVSEELCQTYTYFRNLGIVGTHELGSRLCLKQYNLSICRGDSGGPAFQIVDNRIHHFGIASFISVSELLRSNRCSKGMPAFYLKTSYYIDWIIDSIEKYQNSNEYDINTECSSVK